MRIDMGLNSMPGALTLLPLLSRVGGVLIAVLVARFIYRGYVERSRVRSLKAQGIPILPHSLLSGHLPVFRQFQAAHPPDTNIYLFHPWLEANFKQFFPDLDRLPPVIYLDLWPIARSLAMVGDAVAATQFTTTPSLPKDRVPREFMKPLTGNIDIGSTEGKAWKTWRSRFSQSFSPRNLTALLPELLEEVQVFANGLKESAGRDGKWGPVFQLETKTMNLTLDVIMRAAVDMRLHEQPRTSNSPFKTALVEQIDFMGRMAKATGLLPLGKMPWIRAAIKQNNDILRETLLPKVEEKIRLNEKTGGKKLTIVDLALKYVDQDDPSAAQEKLDSVYVDTLLANLKTFIFAGHDTTASTICFMMKLLQDHPDRLAKLRAEHDLVLGPDPDKAPEILAAQPHTLYSLPYTLGVIKETLRLYPIAATIRDGSSIPGFALTVLGSSTRYPMDGFGPWLSPPGIQRNPDYWPRPNEFLPERWAAAESDPLYVSFKEAWTPFSLGPRNCIGMELAMIELRLVSILTARALDIEEAWDEWDRKQGPEATPSHIVNGQRLYGVGNGTVHPKDGMPVHVKLRANKPAI
ncbi:cytochrome P450 4V3 [Hypoxylon sp. NC1633]|nr:cytochrome P450 4V3 [Hypoxylon sp. NC1633]